MVCVLVCDSDTLSLCLYVCLCVQVYSVVCVPVCDSDCMYVSVCLSLYVCLSICMSACLYVCLCVCLSVSMSVCLSVCSGICVVCVPVCDSDTVNLSQCHTDNDKLLLFAVTHWSLHYDNVYRWRPHSSQHQVLRFLASVTHKMRFVSCSITTSVMVKYQ